MTLQLRNIRLCCYDIEDYKNLKIVEGTIPWTQLISERIASGATRFNLKVYDNLGKADLMAEHNIKLYDNCDENNYVRFLKTKVIEHLDLDLFSQNGHKHKVADLLDTENLHIPVITAGTADYADGQTALADGHIYLYYEGDSSPSTVSEEQGSTETTEV